MNTFSEIYQRCPECGYTVTLPCLACSLGQQKSSPTEQEDKDSDLRLALRTKEYRRYLQIRQMRQGLEANGLES